MVFCTYKSIHRIIVPFAAALRGGGDKRNPVGIRGLPRSCICSCAALRRKAAIVGRFPMRRQEAARGVDFIFTVCARLHEPEYLVMRGRLRTQIGHGKNGRAGIILFRHGFFVYQPGNINRVAPVRHALPLDKA